MKTEKIIFIIQSLNPGGAETFFMNLVNSFTKQGIQPVVIVLDDDNVMIDKLDASIKTHILKRNFRYDLSISKKIRDIIIQENAYKIFCIGAFTFFLSKLLLLQRVNLKFYLSLHTTIPFSFKAYVLDLLYLKLLQKSDLIIFVCKNQQKYYKQKYFCKAADSKVIYNGVDKKNSSQVSKSELLSERKTVRANLMIPLKAKVILKVANLRQEKGHFYAVDALKILHDVYKCKEHLVFVGGADEAYAEKLQNYIVKNCLADYVHLVGRKSDVRPFFAAADIFTLTSYSVETFSIAALEAMSFGLPCCLTEIGGASEMVEEHHTGLLCKPRDASSIAGAWYDLLIGEYDGEYIRNYVNTQFSVDKMVEEYLHVLHVNQKTTLKTTL